MTAPAAVLSAVLADLVAEGDDLDALVADRPEADGATPTPAIGWTVGHQIGHLAWTDEVTLLAAADPGAFASALRSALAGVPGPGRPPAAVRP